MTKYKNEKFYLRIVLILVFSMITLTACNIKVSRYNENPDISNKIIGSNNEYLTRFMPEKLNDILAQATVVIIGEVLEDDTLYTFNPLGDSSNSLNEKYISMENAGKGTIATVKVIETIAGIKPSQDIIKYYQLGQPDTNMLQTKVVKGQKCVFILKYFEEKDYYAATAFEESIFFIDENNKLTSMSNQSFCAKYDGISKETLFEDIIDNESIK